MAPSALLTTCEMASFPFALWRKHWHQVLVYLFPCLDSPSPMPSSHTRTQEGAFMAKSGLTSWLLKVTRLYF